MNYKNLILIFCSIFFLIACGDNKNRTSFEKEKLELEREKLELEKLKANQKIKEHSSTNNDSNNDNTKPEKLDYKTIISKLDQTKCLDAKGQK